MNPDATLLGIAGYVPKSQANRITSSLRKIWRNAVGEPPGNLDEDLRKTRRWFDPVAQGQRLRRELVELPSLPGDVADPGPPLTCRVGSQKYLVTPEGRCVLDLLEHLPVSQSGYVLGDGELLPYERRLALIYREWSRHRLRSVVDLLAGAQKPLQIPAAGVVIALLVNRCTSEDRSLTRLASGSARDVIDKAFFAPVQAFAAVLAPSRRRSEGYARLVSGWMMYEARRRLGEALVVVDARGGREGHVWIRPDAVDDVIDIVTRDIARGHRARVTTEKLGMAYDVLVDELRQQLPKLAGFGLVHERPPETARLKVRLVTRLAYHLSAPA